MSADILKVQGVKEKGYGIIAKLAMQDKRLTIEAKAIYSYFCSFAGTGNTAFPGRDKIISDLMISPKRYNHHFGILKELGYIQVSQERSKKGAFKHNIYTLTEYLPRLDTASKNVSAVDFLNAVDEADDIFLDEDSRTEESNSPCTQNVLTVNERVVIGNNSPCTQNGTTVKKHNFIGNNSPCTQNGTTVKEHVVIGNNSPCAQNDTTVKKPDFIGNNSPYTQNGTTVNRTIQKPWYRYRHTDNDPANINSFKSNINQSSQSCQSVCNTIHSERGADLMTRTDKTDRTANISNINNINNINPAYIKSHKSDTEDFAKIADIESRLKRNIDYSGFMRSYPKDMKLIDGIFAIMLDVFLTEERTAYIAGGIKPLAYVKKVFLSLDYNDLEHVMLQYKSVSERIRKKRKYILTMLYNCKSEINLHNENLVNYNTAKGR